MIKEVFTEILSLWKPDVFSQNNQINLFWVKMFYTCDSRDAKYTCIMRLFCYHLFLKTRKVIKIISWYKDKYLFILTFYDCEFVILLKNISTFFLPRKKINY